MSLGSDNSICKQEFAEAMRPIAGDNVDIPEIQANFGALGLAIYRIATVFAETASDNATDANFWNWVQSVSTWLTALSNWQIGMEQAFTTWAPVTPEGQDLKAKVLAVISPGPAPTSTPTSLKGKIL